MTFRWVPLNIFPHTQSNLNFELQRNCVKIFQIRSFFSPYFLVYESQKSPYLDTFHAVRSLKFIDFFQLTSFFWRIPSVTVFGRTNSFFQITFYDLLIYKGWNNFVQITLYKACDQDRTHFIGHIKKYLRKYCSLSCHFWQLWHMTFDSSR